MTLDCPGCHSKLKVDPAKLPPGAGAAVCPKCRTKILLPGTSPDSDITVQCGRCSSRLKVKVAKLRPTASRSKCPKCGNAVSLPAAPAPAATSQARQAVKAPSPPQAQRKAPPPGMDASAMTRRLDAKEMGVLMGGQEGDAAGARKSRDPIEDTSPPAEAFRSSSADLGQLIDEKVDALGDSPPQPPPAVPRPGEPSVEDLSIEMPPPAEEPSPQAASGTPPVQRPQPRPPSADRKRAPAGSSSSGSRAAPTFSSVMPPAAKRSGGSGRLMPFFLGGVVGGSLVAAALILGGQFLPEGMAPPVPETISAILGGPSLGLLVVMIVLSAISGVFASMALPPEGESGAGVSIFRCTVAAGLVGLLAGVGIALVRGGADLAGMALPAASWTVALIVAGLLTGGVARIFGSR